MAHQCSCGDVHDQTEMGIQYNLYGKIDTQNVECLNECEEGSGATVFKPWEDRLDRNKVAIISTYPSFIYNYDACLIINNFFSQYVESDVDNELLFNIPYVSLV